MLRSMCGKPRSIAVSLAVLDGNAEQGVDRTGHVVRAVPTPRRPLTRHEQQWARWTTTGAHRDAGHVAAMGPHKEFLRHSEVRGIDKNCRTMFNTF